MRFAIGVLILLTAPAAAQSPSRDWRPEDRTVIGDFSRITSIATAMDRVYVTSTSSLVIRQPQFGREGFPILGELIAIVMIASSSGVCNCNGIGRFQASA